MNALRQISRRPIKNITYTQFAIKQNKNSFVCLDDVIIVDGTPIGTPSRVINLQVSISCVPTGLNI